MAGAVGRNGEMTAKALLEGGNGDAAPAHEVLWSLRDLGKGIA